MQYRQKHQAENAKLLLTVKGARAAARYLRFCGFPVTAAVRIIAGGKS